MKVIGILNAKGGVGKTTLTMCLAVHIATVLGKKVAVVDLDPQGSYTDWFRRRRQRANVNNDNLDLFEGADRASEAVEALQLTSPYDYVLLDGPPGALIVTEDAVQSSTMVVIPIRTSGLDI